MAGAVPSSLGVWDISARSGLAESPGSQGRMEAEDFTIPTGAAFFLLYPAA